MLDLVASGELSAGHGRSLLAVKNEKLIPIAARTVIAKGLSVRSTEQLAKRLNKQEKAEPVKQSAQVDYTKELERKMTAKLGRKVKVSAKNKTLSLAFTDSDDLNNLITALCGNNIFDDE